MSIISPLPNTLVNGTPMDAPQVMADFNQIYNDVNNNAAHSGVNADITQLTNLSTPLSVSQGGTGVGTAPLGLNYADGQVQVSVTASTVTVTPFDGGNLIINGTQRSLSAPFSVTPATSPNTAYYVYAAMDVVPTPTAEISTTGWTIDSRGRKNKTGDPSRRLVGLVATDGAGNFNNSASNRGCLNYFNRRSLPLSGGLINGSYAGAGPLALGTSALVTYLTWGDEATLVMCEGYGSNSSSGVGVNTWIGIDGATANYPSFMNLAPAGSYSAVTNPRCEILSEGVHSSNVMVGVPGGNGTWFLRIVGTVRG